MLGLKPGPSVCNAGMQPVELSGLVALLAPSFSCGRTDVFAHSRSGASQGSEDLWGVEEESLARKPNLQRVEAETQQLLR